MRWACLFYRVLLATRRLSGRKVLVPDWFQYTVPGVYFRTSIKASVGLEVLFDKMHAYIADMEAVRRETPADIEWSELDGHHGIPVLNVPLGSPE
eukprot:jgi/Tetstr1/432306/TSEL_021707.t1